MAVVIEERPDVLPLIRLAVLAPSSHNTQPWRFRISGPAIDLLADRTRALPINDPDGRELTISCGCALMNLRLAAAHHGLAAEVQALPVAEDPDWLARVSLRRASDRPAVEAALAGIIECRHTHRSHFDARTLESAVINQLMTAASTEGAWLRPLRGADARAQAAALVAEGDAAQWANPSWRLELARWMRRRRHGDGLTVPRVALPLARLAVRILNMGGRVGAKDRALALSSPLLAVLGTDNDHPQDWLLAGQGLQRVLLCACREGLQASYLNQPIQVAALTPRLRELVGGGHPQMLLRLGYPKGQVRAAPRRPLDAVVTRVAV
ncbi:MAG: Acg family FMN-binding oxidoreductase [Bdellovibrio bacteriovorus]